MFLAVESHWIMFSGGFTTQDAVRIWKFNCFICTFVYIYIYHCICICMYWFCKKYWHARKYLCYIILCTFGFMTHSFVVGRLFVFSLLLSGFIQSCLSVASSTSGVFLGRAFWIQQITLTPTQYKQKQETICTQHKHIGILRDPPMISPSFPVSKQGYYDILWPSTSIQLIGTMCGRITSRGRERLEIATKIPIICTTKIVSRLARQSHVPPQTQPFQWVLQHLF